AEPEAELGLMAFDDVLHAFAEALDYWSAETGAECQACPGPDPSAFRPATEFVDAKHFPTHKRLLSALDQNKWVLTWKRSKNRLLVHAGHMHELMRQLDAKTWNALGATPEAVQSIVDEVERRKGKAERRKRDPR